MENSKQISTLKEIIIAGLLLALLIVLARFISIKTPILVISCSFIPIMLSAYLLGSKYSCLVAGLGDLIGALLFPFGTYFIGFTLAAALSGLTYGLVLYSRKKDFFEGKELIIRLIISSVLVLGIIETPVYAAMLHLFGFSTKGFIAILSTRAIKNVCMLPIQVIVMFFLCTYTRKLAKKYLVDED